MSNFGDLVKRFNWRVMVIRIVVNALTLLFIAVIIPKIYFVDRSILNLFFMAIALGILNALIKPIVQFLTLPYIFATFGLVLAFINALLLILMALLFPERFAVEGLFWAIVAGALMGILGTALESLLGLTMPIIPEEPAELRQYVAEQKPGVITTLLAGHALPEHLQLADASVPPALTDSSGQMDDLPSQKLEKQPQGASLSSTVDPPSPAEPPPQTVPMAKLEMRLTPLRQRMPRSKRTKRTRPGRRKVSDEKNNRR